MSPDPRQDTPAPFVDFRSDIWALCKRCGLVFKAETIPAPCPNGCTLNRQQSVEGGHDA